MKIAVLGGDGFCGWPTALALSAGGHEVCIVDSQVRRQYDEELGVVSLTPIQPIEVRLQAWKARTGREIAFHRVDIRDYAAIRDTLATVRPEALVHFAEQRAAPYSMKSVAHRLYTLSNNLTVTHNLLAALVDLQLDAHLVHLGTMGVYGYGTPGVRLPEGYLTVQMEADGAWKEHEIRFPEDPGSIYHLSKCVDQLLFAFYRKNDRVRVTDLHQGIVWGTQTDETRLDPRLINRFDYDGDFGTVLNRFLVQAVVGHPLTVHGKGGQMRAFIHIRDTVRSIQLALQTPPDGPKVRILNQWTETHRVLDLARRVAEITGASIEHVANPRKEAEDNHLLADNHTLLDLGLTPLRVDEAALGEGLELARTYADRCDLARIPSLSRW